MPDSGAGLWGTWVSFRAQLRCSHVLASPGAIPGVRQEEGWETSVGSFPSPYLLLQTAEEPRGQIVHRGDQTSSLQDSGCAPVVFPYP